MFRPKYVVVLYVINCKYLYHHIVVLDKYTNSNIVYYKHNGVTSLMTENKIQLDATYYFIMLMLGSTCFGHHYAHHQELTTIALVTT